MNTAQPGRYTMTFEDVDRTDLTRVGSKGANLGELLRIDGIAVPNGFCVTVDAYARVLVASSIDDRLERLVKVSPDDRDTIRSLSTEVRQAIEATPIPIDVASAITQELECFGERPLLAVRSSATGEDLPALSFAGQHDSYLNVVGATAVLDRIRSCWASLFTDRAVTYRLRNGIDHRHVDMAVVVQQMVDPRASGVAFTADPATSNRTVAVVEATFGLGDCLVSGRVDADVFRVRGGEILGAEIGAKESSVDRDPVGATGGERVAPTQRSAPAQRSVPVLSDAEVLALVRKARAIEAHFGCAQDVEWCLADGEFLIVQSRPITTLFPVPAVDDGHNRVYVSVGHNQMMTDAMKPLGLSMWQMTTRAPMLEAAGRLFVDVTPRLTTPASRAATLDLFGRGDPLMRDALEAVVARDDFLSEPCDASGSAGFGDGAGEPPPEPPDNPAEPVPTDPRIVTGLIEDNRASVAALREEIVAKSGPAMLDFIEEDIGELQRLLFDPLSHRVIMAAMESTWWLNDHLAEWLGVTNAADVLTLSAPDNVTSEMGLALLDVADVIRPHPEVVSFLGAVEGDDGFVTDLDRLDGGEESRTAIEEYLQRYGARCVGEIDITRPRWSERPSALVPTLLGNIAHFEPGAARRRFDEGARQASEAESELLARLVGLPDGDRKAARTKEVIDRVRTFVGYREYPKYGMVSRYSVYKEALLREADRLVRADVLHDREDIFFLRFDELRNAVRNRRVDHDLIARRALDFETYTRLTSPRVLTSDGETFHGSYRRDGLADGVLVGLAVSAGVVEGRARVVTDMADAELEPGDILVTTHTDPSWSPLFVTVAGLVTEVGGLMTHGAVVAREYGLPAVVSVEHATRQIHEGQRIRVDGTAGTVMVDPAG